MNSDLPEKFADRTEHLVMEQSSPELTPVPIMDLDAVEHTLATLPDNWWMECLTVAAQFDTATPEGIQAMSLHVLQLTTALQVMHERIKGLEEIIHNDRNSDRDGELCR